DDCPIELAAGLGADHDRTSGLGAGPDCQVGLAIGAGGGPRPAVGGGQGLENLVRRAAADDRQQPRKPVVPHHDAVYGTYTASAMRQDRGVARVFITGSADGIGRLTAQLLVAGGHDVILHARNERRAEDARAAVPAANGIVLGDLSEIAAVRA